MFCLLTTTRWYGQVFARSYKLRSTSKLLARRTAAWAPSAWHHDSALTSWVTDLLLPDLDGIAVTRAARAECPGTRVVILTSFNDDDGSVVRAIQAGAIGYVLKDSDTEVLVQAIRAAADGRLQLSPPPVAGGYGCNSGLQTRFGSVLEDGEARYRSDLLRVGPDPIWSFEFKSLVAEVHGSRTHPRPGSLPSNRFEDGSYRTLACFSVCHSWVRGVTCDSRVRCIVAGYSTVFCRSAPKLAAIPMRRPRWRYLVST